MNTVFKYAVVAVFVASARAQTCCQATANCGSCNSGNYNVMCTAPVVPGETGCSCTTQQAGSCPCAKCTWTWVQNGHPGTQTSTANCSVSNQCKAAPFHPLPRFAIRRPALVRAGMVNTYSPLRLGFQEHAASRVAQDLKGIDNDSQSLLKLSDSGPVIAGGVIREFRATVTNLAAGDAIAYEIVWAMVLDNGCKPTATASRDMIFTGGTIPAGASLEITSYVGGWPVDIVKSVSARVSYYELNDGTQFDARVTAISAELRQRRERALDLFDRIQAAFASAPDPARRIEEILSDPVLAKDAAAAIPVMELKGLYKSGGLAPLREYVEKALLRRNPR